MKKFLLLVVTLLSTSLMPAQTMKELPGLRFHAMSENGKWMLAVEQGWIGILNTETDDFQQYGGGDIGYNLGLGNMVTNDGFLVGNIDGKPAILNIDKQEWQELPIKKGDTFYSTANSITNSRKYIAGYIGTGKGFAQTKIKPVIWTMNSDGTYGEYEDLPYPEKDFTGVAPKYILPNCISEDGTVIAAQLMRLDNECLPMVYRKAEDGTWTYEVYDKGLCEEGLEFPECPVGEPAVPSYYDYMTPEQGEAYRQDSIEYKDSVWAYNIGESTEWPVYYPEPKYYMTEENINLFDQAWEEYVALSDEFTKKLNVFRNFYYEHVTPNFYGQNAVRLSTNGKYYATTCVKGWYGTVGDAALFTVDETLKLHDYEDKLYGNCVTNDGDFFVSNLSTAYVYPANSTEKITLIDWLKSKGEDEAAEWLSNIETGTAICSGDGRVISGFYGIPGKYDSWIIKLDETPTGITDIEQSGNSHVKAYDLQGRIVAEGEYNEVRNNLKRGIYIINGRKVVVK